jgi:uncharacterized membrane protein YphA (DoxX/SURF4 family)
MSILLWVLQVLLAAHTLMGAIWKFSHSAEQTMPSLAAIPQGAWLAMSIFEILFSLCLILPAFNKRLGLLAPIAAIGVAAEMLLFTGLHISSGDANHGPIIYWIVVAVICAFIAYGRFVLKPLSKTPKA